MERPATHRVLVERLAADLQPVRRVWSLRTRIGAWVALVAATLAVVAATDLRPDFILRAAEPWFLVDLCALVVGGALLGASALRAAIPGTEPRPAELAIGTALVGLGALLPLGSAGHVGVPLERGFQCAINITLLALVPWAALFFAIRRGAPLAAAEAGALAGAAAFLVAASGGRLACPFEDRVHLVVWHGLPIVLGVVLSTLAGWRWLRSWRAVPSATSRRDDRAPRPRR